MSFSYTKLKSGDWGLRFAGPGDKYQAGAVVDVTTKAGAKKRETLGNRVWTGTDREGNDVTLWSIAGKDSGKQEAPGASQASDSSDGFFSDDGDFS